MDSKELHNLHEAYLDVYELDEDGWQPPTQKRADRMMKQASKLHRTASEIAEPPKESIRAEIKHRQASRVYQASRRMSDSAKERDNEAKRKEFVKEDLYDIILSHLLDEGYAETQEQAEVIMVNMSEDWRESICEELTGERKKRALEKGGYLANRVASGKEGQPVERRNGSGDITMRTTGKGPTKRGGSGVKGRTKSDWYGADDTQGRGNTSARREGKKVKDTSGDL